MQELFNRLSVKTDHISEKVDEMEKHLSSINVNLAVYNERLQEHMRRTEILEELYIDMDKRIRPLENTQMVEKAIRSSVYKSVGLLATIIGAAFGIYRLIALFVQS